ncbi:E3 ubiquitin-protein ligase TRAIP-like [Contarinia nasturtii]|uniref:E3 ubiquitin-protein ligase TRAIP-like n=1 Tax=Contarinia nasturtii TaxID=265458 RepID=UPI0012D4BD31|nr:E3 ubiquitin-protein ligase TRAIP-like [Contarinia nasturtii]
MALPYCIICHNTFIETEEIASTRCGHVYHVECLNEWFQSSKSCPQCRQFCDQYQYNRIYIEFACDEDLACAQTLKKTQATSINSDAEETIKLLLEHIETSPPEPVQKCDIECDNCKDVLQAFDCAHTDMDRMAERLDEKEKENAILNANNENAVKRIDELEIQNRAHEHNLKELNERLDTSERIMASFQTDNIFKDDRIDNLNEKLEQTKQQVQELTNKLNDLKIERENEMNQICKTLKNDFNGNLPEKILRKCTQIKYKANQTNDINDCQSLVPYCGNVHEWEYMMIPVLKNSNNQ